MTAGSVFSSVRQKEYDLLTTLRLSSCMMASQAAVRAFVREREIKCRFRIWYFLLS